VRGVILAYGRFSRSNLKESVYARTSASTSTSTSR
jgi:hypothetical protein